ncbi:MAG: outer membrane protein assembly factor BamC [Pseudomonadota bacterium]
MNLLKTAISGSLLVLLVGCSAMGLGSKRIDYRSEAVTVPPLEIPPDLTAPGVDNRYTVPLGNGESAATYSEYSKYGGNAIATTSAVLPRVKGVRLERNGAQRWLVVEDTAENVWPVVVAFVRENGLTIKTEDQNAGVIETEWSENRAKIPQGGLRAVIGKVFDNLYSSGERDQYRIRLERAQNGSSTEVYLTHRGMEEILSADKSTSKWQARAKDPEMEAIMLQQLMVRFGQTEAQAAMAVANSSGAAISGEASMQTLPDGAQIIILKEDSERAWRRVGLALEGAEIEVEDKDRSKGIYFLGRVAKEKSWLDKLKFWQGSDDPNKRYRVTLKTDGDLTQVSAADQKGAVDEASNQMIKAIYKNINN